MARRVDVCVHGVGDVPRFGVALGPVEVAVSTVDASSDDGNVPGNVLDGNLNTRWSAFGVGEQLWLDLGAEEALLSRVNVAVYQGDTRLQDLDVYLSQDNVPIPLNLDGTPDFSSVSWTLVHHGRSSGTTLQPEPYRFPQQSGRHVRVVGLGNSVNEWNSITEVEVWAGDQEDAPPPQPTLSASGRSNDVVLTWTRGFGPAENVWRVDRTTTPNVEASWAQQAETSALTWTDTAVVENTEYWYRVCGVNVDGPGEWSSVQSATPAAPSAGLYGADKPVWAARLAGAGPFYSKGDYATNSPADGERIVANAASFSGSPSSARWTPSFTEPYDASDSVVPGTTWPTRLRDAAFVAYANDDGPLAAQVVAELVAQAGEPSTDFSNSSRFDPNELYGTHPFMDVAEWLVKLAFAWIWVSDYASLTDQATVTTWLGHAASYMGGVRDHFDQYFVNRAANDYTPAISAQYATFPYQDPPHEFAKIHRGYDNRSMVCVSSMTVCAVAAGDSALKAEGAKIAKEFIRYGVFPEGYTSDFQRGTEVGNATSEEGGRQYAHNLVGHVVTIADVLARGGDTSVYDYSTRDGVYGSECEAGDPDKTLLFAAQSLGKYHDGTFTRYGLYDRLIDGRTQDWESAHDVILAHGNVYWQDAYREGVDLRTGPGMRPFPSSPVGNGVHEPWQGPAGSYPGMLLMFANTGVNPYGG